MRTVVQRVSEASVTVDGQVIGQIGPGLLVLAGFEAGEHDRDLDWMVQKLIRLRLFEDDAALMNHNIVEVGGKILAVPQFTLFASVKKGNRPSWSRAARGELAQPLFARFVELLSKALGHPVQSGAFGADMAVRLINQGPVTLVLDSKNPQ